MKSTHITLLRLCFFLLACALLACSRVKSDSVLIVPKPLSIQVQRGTFVLDENTTLSVPSEKELAVARNFASLFEPSLEVLTGQEGDIVLIESPELPDEAYELNITPEKIEIKARDSMAYFYALQSLRQMLPAEIEGKGPWSLPAVLIKDEPRFAYRGYMLDVSRYFLPKEDLLRLIDCISMLKINKLHLHLSDDNGWRIEIRKYPKLTEVGAWRVDRGDLAFPERRNPEPHEATPCGGYYTQEDIVEIVEFAAQRQIEVIPEIDIPAHSNSALAAYPQYACPVVEDFIGVLPGMGARNSEIIFCAGNEGTYTFLQGILDEVMALFPSRYLHIGGDEAVKTHWRNCPLCQSKMKSEKLEHEEELQGYFMGRMADYVRSKGKEVIGWDEITNAKLPEGSIVMGWQGYGNAALKAAEQGHRFIMAPARLLYLIRYQGPQWFEPLTYFGNNLLRDIYFYEPFRPDWNEEYKDLLLGVQACMWTEFCSKPEDVFYMTFPRLAALAEIAWTSSERNEKTWEGFLKRLDNFLPLLSNKGVNFSRAMFNIQHTVLPTEDGKLAVNLECERPDVQIRYTIDGTEPSAQAALYTEPLIIDGDLSLKAATFASGQQMGQTLTLPLSWNKATAKPFVKNLPSGTPPASTNNPPSGNLPGNPPSGPRPSNNPPAGNPPTANPPSGTPPSNNPPIGTPPPTNTPPSADLSGAGILTNGVRGSLRQSDFEWYTGAVGKDYSLTIDLQESREFSTCSVGCLTNYSMAGHKPRRLIVEVSEDNEAFTLLGCLEFSDEEIFREGNFVEDLRVDTPGAKGRYVRFTIEVPGPCPESHVRPGQASRVYIDEIMID